MIAREVNVLMVDDDRIDTMAVCRSFRELGIANPVIEARDGIEGLACLRGDNSNAKVPSPRLVLLDLNMPRMDGFEFLDALRADPALRRTVVFVMTTSAAAEDRMRAYDRNIAGYILKHPPGEAFRESIAMLQQYWRVITFPD